MNCHQCNLRHYNLLHFEKVIPSETEELSGSANRDSTGSRSTLVGVKDKIGNSHTVRVLLHSGSQANLITKTWVAQVKIFETRTWSFRVTSDRHKSLPNP
ncbi:hypothetical protein PR048_012239 [Dryococelus australis]|uniref:Uncharacterized protein n=1 Tax=Dryococelus australis TaxID=614101 RepID=A0ABQ9HNT8_9NEOP|nr:hypothetical protein PR048_012239 [Dryococelus australis]